MTAFAHLRHGITIAKPATRGMMGPSTIEIASGTGYAGSLYRAVDPGLATEWFADGQMVAMGNTWTLTLEHEGKAIRAGSALGPTSNTIEMWVPWTDLPNVSFVMDVRTGLTLVNGAVSEWSSRIGSKTASQTTVANRPTYSASAFGSGKPGLSFDGTDFLGGLAMGASSTSRSFMGIASFNATGNRTIIGANASSRFTWRRDTNRLMQAVASNAASLASDNGPLTDGVAVLLGLRYTQATVADFDRNGERTARVTPLGNALPASDIVQIGAAIGTQQMSGLLATLVGDDGFRTDEKNERLAGFIAHTCGQTDLLSAAHPYKTAGPRFQ